MPVIGQQDGGATWWKRNNQEAIVHDTRFTGSFQDIPTACPRSRMRAQLRKRWRAAACCGKLKFAISSGWLKNGSVCHPDNIITLSQLIRMRYQFRLSHPDDIWRYDMSSWWHTPPTKSLWTVLPAADSTLTLRLFQQVTVRKPLYVKQPNKFCFKGHILYC